MTRVTREDIHLVISIFLGSLIGVQAWDLTTLDFREQDWPRTAELIDVWASTPEGVESTAGIAENLFGALALPFEVLSVLLLVALVGSVALAVRGDEGGVL